MIMHRERRFYKLPWSVGTFLLCDKVAKDAAADTSRLDH